MREARKAMTELASREQPAMKPVRFHLVTENGAPLPDGFAAQLSNRSQSFDYSEKPDRDGIVDFGLVPAGNSEFWLRSPWGESFHKSISVRIGREISETIVCPSGPQPPVEGQFDFEWPANVRHDDFWLVAKVRRGRRAGTDVWKPLEDIWAYVVIDPQGRTHPIFGDTESEKRLSSAFASPNHVHIVAADLEKPERVTLLPERVAAWMVFRPRREMQPGYLTFSPTGGICERDDLLQVRPNELNHWRLTMPEELLQTLNKENVQAAKPAPVAQPALALPNKRPVRFRLVTEAGAPVPQGFKVRLSSGDEYDYRNEPDQEGIVDFGQVLATSTTLTITSPWGEKLTEIVHFRGDKGIDEVVVCPDGPPKKCQGEFEFQWPKELKAQNLWLAARVVSGRREAERVWKHSEAILLFDPNRQRTQVSVSLRPSSPLFDTVVPRLLESTDASFNRVPLPVGDFELNDLAPILITDIAVLRPQSDPKPGSDVRLFQRIARSQRVHQPLECNREERNIWKLEFPERFKVQVLRVLDRESEAKAPKLTDRSQLLVPR
jgi:hypothetical protein